MNRHSPFIAAFPFKERYSLHFIESMSFQSNPGAEGMKAGSVEIDEMMKTPKILLTIVLFLLALTGIRFAWLQLYTHSDSNKAVNGILDISGWSFDKMNVQSLTGEWTFYPQQLIDPAAPEAAASRAEMASVPGDWSKLLEEPEAAGPFGYGSYRLRVLVAPNDELTYSIRMPALPASSALYVNGRLLGQAGKPAAAKADYTPSMTPYTVTFSSGSGELDLVVHMANFNDHIMGGMRVPIKLGSDTAISRLVWFTTGVQAAAALILLLHALYSVALYIIGAKQRVLLYFAALLGCAVVTILIDDDRILPSLAAIDYEWTYKLYYLAYLGVAAFLLHYSRHLLLGGGKLPGSRLFSALCAVYAVVVLIFPMDLISTLDIVHTVITVVPFFAIPILSIRAIRRGNSDAIFLLLGSAAFTNNVIWGITKNTAMIDISFYPFDLLAGFASFALYWFKLYFRMSDQSSKLAERLKEEDKRKDEFLVNTSHELRNPLHGMLNIAQTVLDSNFQQDEAHNREKLRLLLSVGKRMSLLLNDLHDLTRLKEGSVRLNLTSVQLHSVASGVLDMIRFMAEGKPVRFLNRVPVNFPAIKADEERLVQILFNLLHNALKFTAEGSITVDAAVKDGRAFITVTDTGIGINKLVQQRIFEPYEQGAESETTSVAGLGLGLAISRRLVELHKGELTVSSVQGQGSAFSFTLPIYAPHEQANTVYLIKDGSEYSSDQKTSDSAALAKRSRGIAAETPAMLAETAAASQAESSYQATAAPRTCFSILIVDDDTVNLSIIAGLLSPTGYRIVTAASGKEALALLHTQEWNLVITDVMMPFLSGYELTREIRKHFSLSELPVLLLTARSRTEDIEAGFQAGANDYVTKPVDPLELRSRVRALTELTHTVREQQRTEAAWLQAQIQPHFLFNTLNSISALSELDIEQMRMLLNVFGEYLRSSFDFRNSERLVPIDYELELVRSYLYIKKVRFEERVAVIWEIADLPELPDLQIPPLSIQPLVENAIRHGILKHSRGGTIRIGIVASGEDVEISVQDDGPGMDPDLVDSMLLDRLTIHHDRTGIGLRNTNRRLKQLYGKGLRIESVIGQGTRISFLVRL
jgi:two-component system sensor histidine kinase ChiS